MVMNIMDWVRDGSYIFKVYFMQKFVVFMECFIDLFIDFDDVVIDLCVGSGVMLVVVENLGCKFYGFEIKKDFC